MEQSKGQFKKGNSLPSLIILAHNLQEMDKEEVLTNTEHAEQKKSAEKIKLKKSESCVQLMLKHKKITLSKELIEHLTNEPRPPLDPQKDSKKTLS